ncbi:hypothetical protein PoB_001008600 [Plakobranchus ocellatus]|uniref:Uncharacterized protein n=1 Tax=Plakobranchus ocellatus TaxID=259542 RepID=A0AAV3YJZ8_9GAST|nr:hypothetical protein PoB_001008600 [Plakobranchus ocellatus]
MLYLGGWFSSWFAYIASPQQDDLRISGPPPGQDVGGEARTPRQKGRRRSQGMFAIHCATDVLFNGGKWQDDLRISGPPPGQDVGGEARTPRQKGCRRSQGMFAIHCATDVLFSGGKWVDSLAGFIDTSQFDNQAMKKKNPLCCGLTRANVI